MDLSPQLLNQLYILHADLNKLIDKIHAKGGYPFNKRNRMASAYLAKAVKTNNAIVLLCRNGYGEDAEIISRSLFDQLVDLRYMLRYKRDTMIDRYEFWDYVSREKMLSGNGSSRNMKKLLKERERKPVNGDEPNEEIFKMAKIARKRFRYYGNTWRPKQLWEMAKRVNLLNEYRTMYNMNSQIAHTAPRVINNYARIIKPETLIYTPAQSHQNVKNALISGFWQTLGILREFAFLTKTIDVEEISELDLRYSSIIHSVLEEMDQYEAAG